MTYSEIRVRLMENGTGKVLNETRAPATALPETFTPGQTTLTLGGKPWTVVRAEPKTRAEYIETGQLTLTLEPTELVPGKNILYSTPTINDAVPNTTTPPDDSGSEFLMHEDDWRQIELISAQYDRAIDAEMGDIEGVIRDHSVKNGDARAYQKIFVRQRIKTPLASPIPMAGIKAGLPSNTWTYGGLGFESVTGEETGPKIIPASFALDLRVCVLYGQRANDAATVLGLYFGPTSYGDNAVIATFLDKLMTTHNLLLVDWTWRRKFGPGVGPLTTYLQKKTAG